MIVCPGIKILFCHVPKTAGSTITQALRPWIHSKTISTLRKAKREPLRIDARGWQGQWHEVGGMHSSWKVVRGKAEVLMRDKGYRMLTSVRHPLDRFVSHWAIKAPDMDPMDYIKTTLPEHCKWNVVDMAGTKLDFVLRWEGLADQWDEFCTWVGYDIVLPHANLQKKVVSDWKMREVRDDPRVRSWVRQTFEDDLKRFSYSM